MKRGEIWTAAGGPDYAGKPRPVIILQSDAFSGTESIVVCGLTTTDVDAPLFRIPLEPTATNGLLTLSFAMIDKIVAVRRGRLGRHIGRLHGRDLQRIGQAAILFLGLTERHTVRSKA